MNTEERVIIVADFLSAERFYGRYVNNTDKNIFVTLKGEMLCSEKETLKPNNISRLFPISKETAYTDIFVEGLSYELLDGGKALIVKYIKN